VHLDGRLLGALEGAAVHHEVDAVAVYLVASVGQRGEVGGEQVVERAREERVERRVVLAVFQGVGYHISRF